MAGEDWRRVVRRVRSVSRMFLSLLQSTYEEFLVSSPVVSFPVPSRPQYCHLKTFLTARSMLEADGESEVVGVDEIVDAACPVLGERTVKRITNNLCWVTSTSACLDLLRDILQQEDL